MIEEKAKPKQYYRFWVLPGRWLRVRYDRLALLALLDRWVESIALLSHTACSAIKRKLLGCLVGFHFSRPVVVI